MTQSAGASGAPATQLVEPPETAGERETLLGFIEFYRQVIARKTEGVSEEALHQPLTPSSMTLGGMLTHLAYVEDFWFTSRAGTQPAVPPWSDMDFEADRDADWHMAPAMSPAQIRELFDTAVERSRAVSAAHTDLDATITPSWGEVNERWILIHMVEEYSRHAGHADLLREAIDGTVGD